MDPRRTLLGRIVASALRLRFLVVAGAVALMAVGTLQLPNMRVDAFPFPFSRSCRIVAICRALRSSEAATSTSPAAGTPASPWTSTGREGPALFTRLPV